MTSTPVERLFGRAGRSEIARSRLGQARAALGACRLCAHECAANRLAGERGPCRVGVEARVFSAQVEVSDERELSPVFAIALSGCDWRCGFCITGAESWNPRAGWPLDIADLAAQVRRAVAAGARTVMILGGEPTVHVPSVLGLVAALPDDAVLVWKTNGHTAAPARQLLEGLFDFWVVDLKFGNRACAGRLSGVPGCLDVVQGNLLWAAAHTQLIVRHLVMPGHVECCWRPAATWLATHLPAVKVNLRAGFWPAWRARRHAELRGTVTRTEAEQAWAIADELSLHLVD